MGKFQSTAKRTKTNIGINRISENFRREMKWARKRKMQNVNKDWRQNEQQNTKNEKRKKKIIIVFLLSECANCGCAKTSSIFIKINKNAEEMSLSGVSFFSPVPRLILRLLSLLPWRCPFNFGVRARAYVCRLHDARCCWAIGAVGIEDWAGKKRTQCNRRQCVLCMMAQRSFGRRTRWVELVNRLPIPIGNVWDDERHSTTITMQTLAKYLYKSFRSANEEATTRRYQNAPARQSNSTAFRYNYLISAEDAIKYTMPKPIAHATARKPTK